MRRFLHLGWFVLLIGMVVPAGAQEDAVRFEPTRFENMYDLYSYNKERGRATLITSDSVLHTTHILFDYTLRAAELKHFENNLRELTKSMMDRMMERHMDLARMRFLIAPPPYGYYRSAAYFGVAHKLLNPEAKIPEDIVPLVDKEIALIMAHNAMEISPVMGVTEDYTQYVPRGHYTRNEKFRRFFLAMMWYGRAGFPISGEKKPRVKLTLEETRANAWAGIMLARELYPDPKVLRMPNAGMLWDSIYKPTQFIVGTSDDLTPLEYITVVKKVFGDTLPGGWTKEAQAQTDQFIAEAIKLRPPRIFGTLQSEEAEAPPVALRFFGQRFTPDSDAFQRLVHTKVLNRFMPSGLDVMAAFGSTRALKWQQELGVIGKYEGYITQLNGLILEINKFDNAAWSKTAYLLWMRALRDLLAVPVNKPTREVTGNEPIYPPWFLSTTWQDKQLNAALGSWAELRHDTILYVKQSYTLEGSAMPMPAKEPTVYVEPVPQVYHDLYVLVKTMQAELKAQGVFPEELAPNYQQFLQLLAGLELRSSLDISPIKFNIALSDEQKDGMKLIEQISEALLNIETIPQPLRGELAGKEDARMAVIADVHTDTNAKKVLEVGVGRVMAVAVPVQDGEKTVQAYGPIFSYYEFAHPMGQRLTDAAWQQMLDQGKAGDPFILSRYLPKR